MKKSIPLILIFFSLFSCTNLIINSSFQHLGVYDKNVKLEKLSKKDTEVVFIPMIHLSNATFYSDVNRKIDSLKNEGYYFYYEIMKTDKKDTLTLYKYKKMMKMPIPKDKTGYKSVFDTLLKSKKVKLKMELVSQPSYESWGLDNTNSKNVDISMKELINNYESMFGEIKLEPCDFETSLHQKTVCKDTKEKEKNLDKIIIDSRNDLVLKELSTETRKKIAIIYGKAHLVGIRKELLKMGYVEEIIK